MPRGRVASLDVHLEPESPRSVIFRATKRVDGCWQRPREAGRRRCDPVVVCCAVDASPGPSSSIMKLLTALCCIGAASAFVAPVAPRGRSVKMAAAADKSKSIPFLPRPEALPGDGSLPGDVGKHPQAIGTGPEGWGMH